MSLKELERDKTGKVVPEKKTERPKEWQVVMFYGAQYNMPCCACLLSHVFKMSTMTAMEHISTAKKNGKVTVYESTRDAAETKAEEARGGRDHRARNCSPNMTLVDFEALPK